MSDRICRTCGQEVHRTAERRIGALELRVEQLEILQASRVVDAGPAMKAQSIELLHAASSNAARQRAYREAD